MVKRKLLSKMKIFRMYFKVNVSLLTHVEDEVKTSPLERSFLLSRPFFHLFLPFMYFEVIYGNGYIYIYILYWKTLAEYDRSKRVMRLMLESKLYGCWELMATRACG